MGQYRRCAIKCMAALGVGISALSGCGIQNGTGTGPAVSYQEKQDGPEESDQGGESAEESLMTGELAQENTQESAQEHMQENTQESAQEYTQESPAKEDGAAEVFVEGDTVITQIYNGGDTIAVTEDMMAAQVPPEELLKGDPILYNRFVVDGWVFEWMISDYSDEDNWFWEDGVLVVSREGDSEEAQIINVRAEGGYAVWVSAKHKFEYVDVNFDGLPDLLICTGHHGNQGLLTYYCFLQTGDGFEESPSFTEIPNPAVDADNKLILSQWRNTAVSHSWAEYVYQDNAYVLHRELCEDLDDDIPDRDVWVWTVNGEVIGRSDELSAEEIGDLIYNENSEWGIEGDRWRTLYNNGLTTDFSIYGEP